MTVPSGEQHVLASGRQQAVITEVGATLRAYEFGGIEVCRGFDEDQMCLGSKGQVLAPWPNRLRDGRYEFEGVAGRAPLDEPERSNAIHGLVRWLPWRLVERQSASVRLECRLVPQPAYPYHLLLQIEYRLDEHGLTVSLQATAQGSERTPFGAGFHPYLAVGTGNVDAARLALPAERRLLLDDRALPVGSELVAGTPYDRITGFEGAARQAPIEGLRVDDCFTDVAVGSDGRWRAELLPDGGQSPVVLWADAVYPYIMCYSSDTLPEQDRRRGIAVEPMTCPPDALRTGDDVIALEPGESFHGSWGIVPAGFTRG